MTIKRAAIVAFYVVIVAALLVLGVAMFTGAM